MDQAKPHTVWLWRSDEDNWERFRAEDTAQIESALEVGNQGVVLERNDTTYFLDLSRLTQTNGCTGRIRSIFSIKRGSSWLVENPKGLQPFFSEEETQEIEQAFFEFKDCYIVQRCTRTYFVDLMKLTVTDLFSGSARNIRVSRDEVISSCTGSIRCADKDDMRKASFDNDDTECTEPSVSESSFGSDHHVSIVHKLVRRSSRPGKWRWENDSDSWSTFDDDIAAAIENSWESGAPEMMFERGSDVYFVDLQNLTQVNVSTGFTRAIERVEES